MKYEVEFRDSARKELKKIDLQQARIIISWIEKNLAGCTDPRRYGKALTGDKKGYWRYRVGCYRLIAEIDDSRVTILMLHIAHRREAY